MKTNKKGQEEIVGFVLIVVLVSVVILIFLGIMLRNPGNNERESIDVYNFITASLSYTTNCSNNGEYYDVGRLVRKCYQEEGFICQNGERGCEVVNSTWKEILDTGWQVSPEGKYKAYVLNVTQSNNFTSRQNKEFIFLSKGNCSENIIGSEEPIPLDQGNMIVSLKICS